MKDMDCALVEGKYPPITLSKNLITLGENIF